MQCRCLITWIVCDLVREDVWVLGVRSTKLTAGLSFPPISSGFKLESEEDDVHPSSGPGSYLA